MGLEQAHRHSLRERPHHPDEPQPTKWGHNEGEPDKFEWIYRAAQDLTTPAQLEKAYRERGWACPVSGDKTTIRKRFLR